MLEQVARGKSRKQITKKQSLLYMRRQKDHEMKDSMRAKRLATIKKHTKPIMSVDFVELLEQVGPYRSCCLCLCHHVGFESHPRVKIIAQGEMAIKSVDSDRTMYWSATDGCPIFDDIDDSTVLQGSMASECCPKMFRPFTKGVKDVA